MSVHLRRARLQDAHEASLAEAVKRAEDLGKRTNWLEKELEKRPTQVGFVVFVSLALSLHWLLLSPHSAGSQCALFQAAIDDLQRRLSALSAPPQTEGLLHAEKQETDTSESLIRLRAENTRLVAQLQEATAAAEAARAKAAETLRETEEKIGFILRNQKSATPPNDATRSSQGNPQNAVGAGVLQLIVAQRDSYKNSLAEAEQVTSALEPTDEAEY